jgi:anti-anti-sigma regulatory factor
MTAAHRASGGGALEPPWGMSSVSVTRNGGTVVVTVAGVLDHAAAAGLRHILSDVMYGQGNLFVRVDFDVLAEASVLAVLSSLDDSREGTGEFESTSARQPLFMTLSSQLQNCGPAVAAGPGMAGTPVSTDAAGTTGPSPADGPLE